ncbi:MAG: hypothetical protein AB7U20_01295 [Planctomycetaceae bacterium]
MADLLALARFETLRVAGRLEPAVVVLAAPVRFLADREAAVRFVDFAAVVVLWAAPARDFVDLPAVLRAVVLGDFVDFFAVRDFVVLAAISVGSFSRDGLGCLVLFSLIPTAPEPEPFPESYFCSCVEHRLVLKTHLLRSTLRDL